MNLVSQMGVRHAIDAGSPIHLYPPLAPSPRPERRHTIVDHNIRSGFLERIRGTGSIRSGLDDIHLSDFSKRRHSHIRSPSNATDKISLSNHNNNNVYQNHGSSKDEEDQSHRPLITTKDYLHVDSDQDRVSSYGMSLMENLPLVHDCTEEGCERVIINVSGLKFETQVRTLNRLPHTLLGDPEKRKKFWDEQRQEFFFDRHRPTFQAVLYYYQSGGRLKKPLEVPMDIFLHELQFYELGGTVIDCFKQNEGYIIEAPEILVPKEMWKKRIFEMLEYPESSLAAKIFALFSVIFILTSVVTFCVETLPQFKGSGCVNVTIPNPGQIGNETTVISVVNWTDPLFIVETCCIVFFVVEIVLRFVVSPSKFQFLKMTINWIDLISIAPYFVLLGLNLITGRCGGNHKSSVLSVLRVLRVVRILKLSKHSQGLKILGKTLQTSIRELSMFILFLCIATVIFAGAIYYVEMGQQGNMFDSIPDAFWWAIVTMTTVGYGDYVPVGLIGKMLGGLCVLSGVLAIALPVPVIVANFNNFYRHYTGQRPKRRDPYNEMKFY